MKRELSRFPLDGLLKDFPKGLGNGRRHFRWWVFGIRTGKMADERDTGWGDGQKQAFLLST